MTFLLTATRRACFLAILAGTVLLTAGWLPYHHPFILWSTISEALRTGDAEHLSNPDFVFALAWLLFTSALGILLGYLVTNVVVILYINRSARRQVERAMTGARSPTDRQRLFSDHFDGLRQQIGRSWLLGHAFSEFSKTVLETEPRIGTVRPQLYFNMTMARERLPGLKLLGAVPGYFVGVGLLLTFIGLVLALHKAGQAAEAQDAQAMQKAMTDLLNIATFKFATSIAGLAASIVLSFAFRLFAISVEASFDRFCAALENGLAYRAPQAVSIRIREILEDQLTQLKDITQGDFFARMGQSVAPYMNDAISSAMMPISQHIRHAVDDLRANSQSGMSDMLQEFGRSLHGSAGAEMQALVGTLVQMQQTLAAMQGDLRGSGEDFGRRMAEASEQLKRLVEEAGQSFGRSSGESRDALAAVAATLRETIERANADVAAGLGAAAANASGQLEEAMGTAMGKLDGPVATLGERLDTFARQMLAVETALGHQKTAIEGTATEARKIADVFNSTAQDMRIAAAPLAQIGDRFAAASEGMGRNIERSAQTLGQLQTDASALASELQATNSRTQAFWTEFKDKFDDVDTALGKAVATLSASTADQTQLLSDRVREVDAALAEAIGKLHPALSTLSEAADSIADTLGTEARQHAANGHGNEAR